MRFIIFGERIFAAMERSEKLSTTEIRKRMSGIEILVLPLVMSQDRALKTKATVRLTESNVRECGPVPIGKPALIPDKA